MTLPQPPEVTIVENEVDTVRCDGGGGAAGHPMVYYRFGGRPFVECGYCDRRFVKRSHAEKTGEAA